MVKARVEYNINLDKMIASFPAGDQRDKASAWVDDWLGIESSAKPSSRGTPVAASARRGAGKRAIMSSEVTFPNGLPDDEGLAQSVQQISGVLGKVNSGYFPQMDYLTAEISETQTLLYFGAYGMDFRVGIVIGTNGQAVGVLFVLDNKQILGPAKIESLDQLRSAVDMVGAKVGGKNV